MQVGQGGCSSLCYLTSVYTHPSILHPLQSPGCTVSPALNATANHLVSARYSVPDTGITRKEVCLPDTHIGHLGGSQVDDKSPSLRQGSNEVIASVVPMTVLCEECIGMAVLNL